MLYELDGRNFTAASGVAAPRCHGATTAETYVGIDLVNLAQLATFCNFGAGSFSAVAKPILRINTRFAACFKFYKSRTGREQAVNFDDQTFLSILMNW